MDKEKPSNGENDALKKEQTRILKNLKKKIREAAKRGYSFFNKLIGKGGITEPGNSPLVVPKPDPNPTPETVQRLKELSATLYDRALWIDPDFDPTKPEYTQSGNTSGVWSGNEGRDIERSRASRKGWENRRSRVLDDPDDGAPFTNPQPVPAEPVWEPIFNQIRAYIMRLENEQGFGPPWVQDARERSCSYLLQWFDDLAYEHICNETAEDYAKYLQSKAKELSVIIDNLMLDSDDDDVLVNTGRFLDILNQGPLSADQYDAFTDWMHGGYG